MHRRRAIVACPPVIHYSEDGEQETFLKHRLLGYGGFAAVYEVERVSDECRMAAKVLPLSSLADSNKLRRVQNEIDINQLLHHPHVVTFLGSFQDDHNVYLLQELCCITLSELLRHVGRMSELQAAHILWQVLSALEHLHGCRVAHRDLKLSNMFLARDGTVKVGDLGLACHLPYPASRRRSTCGSLNWMAPEVLRPGSAGYGLEVDIWALGVVLFTLLVGRPPFAGGRDSAAGGAAGGGAADHLPPQTTCGRILAGCYRMPGPEEVVLGPEARDLVARLLVVDPAARPSLEQLRTHAFFQLHLGPLATAWGPATAAGEGAGPPLREELSRAASGQQSPLLEPGSSGGVWEERWTAAAGGDLTLGPYSPPPLSSPSLPFPAPPAMDIRLVLSEAGLAALAASAAGGSGGAAGRDSTSGSYMDLSQSEQCSAITAASTTTTATAGRADGGPPWQMGVQETLLCAGLTFSHSHDPASRTRSQPHLAAYRLSEQVNVSGGAGGAGLMAALHCGGGCGRQSQQQQPPFATLSKLFARGSVPSLALDSTSAEPGGLSPTVTGDMCCNVSAPSFSSLTPGTTEGTGGGGGTASSARPVRLLAGVTLPDDQQPPPPPPLPLPLHTQQQHPQPRQHHGSQDHHHHRHHPPPDDQQGQPYPQPAQPASRPQQEGPSQPPQPPPAPFVFAPGSCKALPGAGADQNLPQEAYRAHAQAQGLLASPFLAGGPTCAAVVTAAVAYMHAAVHPRGGGAEYSDVDACGVNATAFASGAACGGGGGGAVTPGSSSHGSYPADRPSTVSRSYTGTTQQASAARSSTASSSHVANFAHAALGQQHQYDQHRRQHSQEEQQHQLQHQHQQHQQHQHQQQRLQPQPRGLSFGRRRRTLESAMPPAGTGDAAAVAEARGGGEGVSDSSSGGAACLPSQPPALSVLRAAFLTQYSSCNHAAATQTRRLQATRSAHARDSMRIAAGLRSVPGAGVDEPENDGSSDTVRSYADSLEAMLLGGNARAVAAAAAAAGGDGGGGGGGGSTAYGVARSGPAPVAPSGMGRHGLSHPHPHAYAVTSGLSSGAVGATPSVPSAPIILRHARSSIGASSTRRAAGAGGTAVAGASGPGGAGSPLLPGPQRPQVPSWPHVDGACALRTTQCVTSLSSGRGPMVEGLQLLSSGGLSDMSCAAAAAGADADAERRPSAALGRPALLAALPPHRPHSQAGLHSSAATTPQHSEPLSLAVFAIQQSRGLPVRGVNSPPPGLDGPTLEAGLCVCSAADSPLRDGGWSGEQATLRGAAPGRRPPERSQSGAGSDAAAQALEAERAVAGLDLCASTARGEPSSPRGFGGGAEPRSGGVAQRPWAAVAAGGGSSAIQGGALEGAGWAGGPCRAGWSEDAPSGRRESGGCREPDAVRYTAPGAIQARRGSAGLCLPRSAHSGRQSREEQRPSPPPPPHHHHHQQQQQQPWQWTLRALPALMNARKSAPEPESDRTRRQQGPQELLHGTQQGQQQGEGQEQGQEEEQLAVPQQGQQQQPAHRKDDPAAWRAQVGSSFTLRMNMHPWRAMALTRVLREAVQLQRLQRDEVEAAAAAAEEQALEELGDTSGYSAVSATAAEASRTHPHGGDAAAAAAPRAASVSTAAQAALAASAATAWAGSGELWRGSAPSATAPRTAVAAAAAAKRPLPPQARACGSPQPEAAEPAAERPSIASEAACGGTAPPGGTPLVGVSCGTPSCAAAHTTPTPSAAAGCCIPAPDATRTAAGRCLRPPPVAASAAVAAPAAAEQLYAATGCSAAAACVAVAAAAPMASAAALSCSPPRKPSPGTGWSLDRLGFCCPLLYGSGGCNGSPSSSAPTPRCHGAGGDTRSGCGDSAACAPAPKRRFASLDVERVLRHLESCDPDDVAVVQCAAISGCTSSSRQTPTPTSTAADPATLPAGAAAAGRRPGATSAEPSSPLARGLSAQVAAHSNPPGSAAAASSPCVRGSGHSVEEGAVAWAWAGGAGTPEVAIGLTSAGAEGGAIAATASAAAPGAAAGAGLYIMAGRSKVVHAGSGMASGGASVDAGPDGRGGLRTSLESLLQVLGCDVGDGGRAEAAPTPTASATAVAASAAADDSAGVSSPQPCHADFARRPHPQAPVPPQGMPRCCAASCPAVGTAPPPTQPMSLEAPRRRAGCSVSATGMTACEASNGGMLQDAVPEMDPEALAELASRLRSKSFKEGLCGSRNGSFTYRPSRMMPVAQRSPSRRGAAAPTGLSTHPEGGGGGAAEAAEAAGTDAGLGGGGAEATDPESGRSRAAQVHPREVLMVKWLDYSSKYGLSYVLSNGAVGVLFRDGTQLLRDRGDAYAWLLGMQAVGGCDDGGAGGAAASSQDGGVLLSQAQPLRLHGGGDTEAAPLPDGGHLHDVTKKLRLLRSFEGMLLGGNGGDGGGDGAAAHVVNSEPPQTSALHQPRPLNEPHELQPAAGPGPGPPPAQPPTVFVTSWTRTQKALVLCMSSGTLQALFCDGSELVVREKEDEVEFLARDGRRTSCSLRAARSAGPKNSLSKRIQYATMLIHSRAGKH